MRRRLLFAVRALDDAVHDIRHEGFVRIGPIYVTTWGRHFDSVKNGFDLGRDYEGAVRDRKLQS